MMVVAGAAVGIMVLATLMRRYAPTAPVLSRLMLRPMQDQELADLSRREALVHLGHLVGTQGVATTQLTPAGKARFDDQLIDVIADGEVIDRGCQITVVDVRGNRIVVQQAPPSADG